MNHDEIQPSFNMAKEAFVDALIKEGFLTPENGALIKSAYAITLQKKSWLGSFISRYIWKEDGSDANQMKIVIVKIV